MNLLTWFLTWTLFWTLVSYGLTSFLWSVIDYFTFKYVEKKYLILWNMSAIASLILSYFVWTTMW